uniref:Uncharacterized protein n=1 Tax=Oryza sativa subsp. japonica TaxID=39947 RepID=Q7Y1P0_ORYSJ|nr:hypothetical protein [Oryza sativa Japonica Group]
MTGRINTVCVNDPIRQMIGRGAGVATATARQQQQWLGCSGGDCEVAALDGSRGNYGSDLAERIGGELTGDAKVSTATAMHGGGG